jgi:hypothetical protein
VCHLLIYITFADLQYICWFTSHLLIYITFADLHYICWFTLHFLIYITFADLHYICWFTLHLNLSRWRRLPNTKYASNFKSTNKFTYIISVVLCTACVCVWYTLFYLKWMNSLYKTSNTYVLICRNFEDFLRDKRVFVTTIWIIAL